MAAVAMGASACAHGSHARTMAPDTAEVTIRNLSGYAICDVIVGPAKRNAARDLLARSEMILPGTSRRFDVAAGRYDVRLNDCGGATLFGRRGVAFVGARNLVVRSVEVRRPRTIRSRIADDGVRPRRAL